ncbi:hypothetical protein FRB98_004390 [Tulasnella sp. 332]|nr:hypothetical protein FRB98_004390 [Tulasnella sp. 332]
MFTLQYTIVDAFTSSPFAGNPAAVIVLPHSIAISDPLAQKISAEFNLSETAFVVPRAMEDTEYSRTYGLRWFTPKNEVPLCGHATLATARVLFADVALVPEGVNMLKFETLSGTLTAKRVPDTPHIELEFPAYTLIPVGAEELEKVARVVDEAVGGSVAVLDVQKADRFMLVRLDTAFDLENASVNPTPFVPHVTTGTRSTVLTSERPSALAPTARFISRMFAPASGIPEDPVTGSAHCALAPYWSEVLKIPPGEVFTARQASSRGGDLDVIWEKDKGRVKLRGNAVVVARGEMYLPPKA